jgi:3-oxoacyl-[acyl-carrier protein] reductase
MNKVVIVTGSSRGIGEAIAIEFAKAGYNLVINSRHPEELSVSKKEIMKVANSNIDILEFPGDISEEGVCSGIVDAAIQNSVESTCW